MLLKSHESCIKSHESCKCVCRLGPIICNKKQKCNEGKCRCECLININVIINFEILIVVSVNLEQLN